MFLDNLLKLWPKSRHNLIMSFLNKLNFPLEEKIECNGDIIPYYTLKTLYIKELN